MEPRVKAIEDLGRRLLIGGGAIGTRLRESAGAAYRLVELLNLRAPDAVRAVHRDYRDAGADALLANTFAANPLTLAEADAAEACEAVNRAGVALAREVAGDGCDVWASVGPLSLGLRLDDFPHDRLLAAYATQCRALAGADALVLETFAEPREAAAALAAATATGLPVIFQMGHTGRGQSGLLRMDVLLDLAVRAGVRAIGVNCRHPGEILEAARHLATRTALPLVVAPNAGSPTIDRGRVLYRLPPEEFVQLAEAAWERGVAMVAGCCGTGPEHVRAAVARLRGRAVRPREPAATPASVSAASPVAPHAAENPVRRLMRSDRFLVSVEVRADRGSPVAALCEAAVELAAAGADFVDVPDKPGASVSRDAAVVAARLQEDAGKPAIVHRAAIHGNLLEAHSSLIGYGDLGLHGVLALTGDSPSIGPLGSVASRVGDLKSSVELLRLIRTLRDGATLSGEPIRDPPDLCAGCAMGQPTPAHLEWLRRKLDAGAEFVFSQPIFDWESAERLLEAVTPLTARLFVGLMPLVSRKNAEFLAQGRIPGIRAPASLVAQFARYERPEDQRRFGWDLAADLVARLAHAARSLYLIPPFGQRGYSDAADLVRTVRSRR